MNWGNKHRGKTYFQASIDESYHRWLSARENSLTPAQRNFLDYVNALRVWQMQQGEP